MPKRVGSIFKLGKIASVVAEEYNVKPEEILKARLKNQEARKALIEPSYQLNFKKRVFKSWARNREE